MVPRLYSSKNRNAPFLQRTISNHLIPFHLEKNKIKMRSTEKAEEENVVNTAGEEGVI